MVGLAVFAVSFSLVRQKKGVALGILAFLALRFGWAGVMLWL
jgi:hypothetical protein